MEISGRVLREVEFRDRLRGYDTDEVDEFLEKVAVAIDELRAEVQNLRDEADRHVDDLPLADDDSIRRTLVLAQRTADMAIAEAREEAARVVTEARAESEALVSQAQQSARCTRDEAESQARESLERLSEQRSSLEREVRNLAELVERERAHLSESLQSALQVVNETIVPTPELTQAARTVSSRPMEEPAAKAPEPRTPERPTTSGEPTAAFSLLDDDDPDLGAKDGLDDDDLWSRWAQGEELSVGDNGEPRPQSSGELPLNRRPESWTS